MTKLLKRTNICGDLNRQAVGQEVVLNGWVAKRRNLGGLIFCDLRDRTGIVQLVFDDEIPKDLFDKADSLRSEYVIGVKGRVEKRKDPNPDLATGEIEVFVNELEIYAKAETPPIYIKDDDTVDDNLRLKYRYLDLRKNRIQKNLKFRHDICKLTRDFFDGEGFMEVETPVLIKPTPEGARDYLVPSRIHPGSFYALPQSPQMFKQLLMVGGCDRYMQIAKCFRDEDLRADRQPEFTQIDLEMSFVDIDDVIEVQERFLQRLFKEMLDEDIEFPLMRLSYDQAMDRYGSDKPDLRFGFEIKDIGDLVAHTDFQVFKGALESGGTVRGIAITGAAEEYTRKKIDKLTEKARDYGAKGLVWMRIMNGEIASSVNKFFSPEELAEIADRIGAKDGDLVLICADSKKVVLNTLGFLRRHMADQLGLLENAPNKLLWVVDFPMFEEDEEGNISAMHHPFTSPREEDLDILMDRPLDVKANAYDIVLNGVELGGGSIRIHDRDLQDKIFTLLGLDEKEKQEKFGFLLEAFKYGAPPHGGIAYGLDRLVMLFTGQDSIREVMAFPKNQAAQCMVSEAPSLVSEDQLAELGITLKK